MRKLQYALCFLFLKKLNHSRLLVIDNLFEWRGTLPPPKKACIIQAHFLYGSAHKAVSKIKQTMSRLQIQSFIPPLVVHRNIPHRYPVPKPKVLKPELLRKSMNDCFIVNYSNYSKRNNPKRDLDIYKIALHIIMYLFSMSN